MNNTTTLFREISAELGITNWDVAVSTGQQHKKGSGQALQVHSPVDGSLLATLHTISQKDYEEIATEAQKAFQHWRTVPAPVRGQIVREIGEELRKYKTPLGKLVTLEMGKILQEGLGEVQEMIDVCDFATGLSRQLYGLTMHSERPSHRMYEQWHPIGIVGIISAFNFPVAVWSWNAMLAAVCGDVCIWKPSEKVPLTAIACQYITAKVLQKHNLPEGIFCLMVGGADAGQWLTADHRVGMVSATGSVRMGKKVGEVVAARLGKALLELGGNNAIIVTPDANLEMAVRAIVFGSVGTCGQRCTSTRRLIIHEQVYDTLVERLKKAYANLPIGDPLKEGTLVGPLIDGLAVEHFVKALEELKKEGGKILAGGEVLSGEQYPGGRYVKPVLAEAQNHYKIVQEETFAPILYLIKYTGGVEAAIQLQNDVRQGLSSSIFSQNLRETELFLSQQGSDCGIANVNIGTSGAEIGGAFGGEKETGGGRESGSDAWKAYMRRQTNTINFGQTLPLAQGIRFEI